ncbi:membrane protein insertase YidC [Actinomycetaceae bacterium MB13-C1-2]|nr:membrane protein insertase YidC [Actinomycetaceae bacterium MB13-C1-2]
MDSFLHPIIVAFAWIWVQIHKLLTLIGFSDGPGIAWAVAIVIMTILVRVAILPLYLKQIRSSRNMQVIQPEMKKIQEKYKGKTDPVSRQRQQEETMELYKKAGSSPMASCWPMLVQLPVMFALYRVIFAVKDLAGGTYSYDALGPLTQGVAQDITDSQILGVGMAQTMATAPGVGKKAIFVVLIIIMVALQFLTMRMSMSKNMPAVQDPNNPMVRSQKTMMYMMPLMYVFTGMVFQMGMLMYMITTAIFAWAQQLWVIKTIPTPGSPAADELREKREEKYQAWATGFFAEYDQKAQALKADPEALEELNVQTLAEAEKHAKKQKVSTDFPDDWDAASKVAILRGLAVEPWKTIPDEVWLKQMVLAKNSQVAAEAARAARPKKLSREQRMRLAQREQQDAAAAKRREEKQARKAADRSSRGGDLSPEEVERRRQQRKAERRAQNKGNQKKTGN